MGEAEISGELFSLGIVGAIVKIGTVELKSSVFRSDVLLAPKDGLFVNVHPHIPYVQPQKLRIGGEAVGDPAATTPHIQDPVVLFEQSQSEKFVQKPGSHVLKTFRSAGQSAKGIRWKVELSGKQPIEKI